MLVLTCVGWLVMGVCVCCVCVMQINGDAVSECVCVVTSISELWWWCGANDIQYAVSVLGCVAWGGAGYLAWETHVQYDYAENATEKLYTVSGHVARGYRNWLCCFIDTFISRGSELNTYRNHKHIYLLNGLVGIPKHILRIIIIQWFV